MSNEGDRLTLIGVGILQRELASLIARSRSNVSRGSARLRRVGFEDCLSCHSLVATSARGSTRRGRHGEHASHPTSETWTALP